MKLQKLFKRSVEIAMQNDPRDAVTLKKLLKKETDRQTKLTGREKEIADSERTWNPYADSRVLAGSGEAEIVHLAVGIDINTEELLLIDRLRSQGKKIDAVMTHHPEGRALADLQMMLPMQADLYALGGVPINQSEFLLNARYDILERRTNVINTERTPDAAKLLGIPLIGCHTIGDNMVWKFIEKRICQRSFDDLNAIVEALLDMPEFLASAKLGAPPFIVHGGKHQRPGKIVATGFTGGTNGSDELIEKQAIAGVGTVLCMHFTEKEVELAKKHNVCLIQCPHIASDSMGMNLLLDALKKEEKRLTVLPFSGFMRVER
jgi:hypothetical protein